MRVEHASPWDHLVPNDSDSVCLMVGLVRADRTRVGRGASDLDLDRVGVAAGWTEELHGSLQALNHWDDLE